ncbi:MAG: hypothetical protein GF409_00695 [Candidatus Omnitrophica bacterium]|nr:hypothetical protein [Candidatus Omnitrophota bacterium]
MKCDICGRREATVHLTEVINDKVTKLHICERCAREKSEQMQSHFGLHDLLAGLVDIGPDLAGEAPPFTAAEAKCPQCGMGYYDFQQTGRLGCGACYEAFEKNLSELLKKIHGSDRHVGKIPFKAERPQKEQKDLIRLRKELAELVRREEFEKAALLRDRIKELEEREQDET